MELPQFQPMTLARTKEAFDHADFVFELKYDGFRALAYVDDGRCRLVSRRNHTYKTYAPLCQWIGKHLRVRNAVLDGELACLDEEGATVWKSQRRRDDGLADRVQFHGNLRFVTCSLELITDPAEPARA